MKLPNPVRNLLSRLGLPESPGFWLTIAAIILAVEIILTVVFWDWLSGEESGSTTIRNIGFIMAGSVALPLAIWRGLVADTQATASQRQADTAQQSLLNERYERGAAMLGSSAVSVRLAGIYALRRLAEDHPENYHVQVMSVLSAFARHPTADKEYEAKLVEQNADPSKRHLCREDVRTAVKQIGTRNETQVDLEKSEGFALDLMGVDLTYTSIGDANLSGAMLHYAELSHANIFDADLSNAFLRGAVLKNADLANVDFTGATTWGINLSRAKMRRLVMPDLPLYSANMSDAELSDVDLSDTYFTNAILSGVTIADSDLSNALFLHSKLSGAEILGSDLSGAKIARTDMSGATLRNTNLSGTYFYEPVDGIITSQVTGLTQAQLDDACADPNNPPKLEGVLDAETGEPLVWRGKPCE